MSDPTTAAATAEAVPHPLVAPQWIRWASNVGLPSIGSSPKNPHLAGSFGMTFCCCIPPSRTSFEGCLQIHKQVGSRLLWERMIGCLGVSLEVTAGKGESFSEAQIVSWTEREDRAPLRMLLYLVAPDPGPFQSRGLQSNCSGRCRQLR
ncbi:hypothetical protein ASPBRDRAFT_540436 [Aspergillus brasiliensis CBS 101740]|uniref:Uncharacterized protein n=1 Tax=Aspergillus brasiliensis (strain CBS 101740 / IMI 381727 / IBT 21946) TaxID=767769 RepID=A0A1L9ULC5_ASPBC|nr:hypothetical protein ASPBRDRAFT_540436 [Aspergillus brasiliensis CBS 101740]